MKPLLSIFLLFFPISLSGQKAEDFGFRHLQTIYKHDTVDILIKSKKGEEQIKKPLLLFCQGSLPIPLIIKYNNNGMTGIYSVFPFNPDSLSEDYHLAIISKPFVPLIADQQSLSNDLTVEDSSGNYRRRNLLDYYVGRNIEVINFLQQQRFVSSAKLVVAGHSEGSAIAANIAYKCKKVTALIYSGGSPLGRIMTIIERARSEQWKDSTVDVTASFSDWEKTVENRNDINATGDTYKGLYQFSNPPPIELLLKLNIPVLVTYGTKDFGAVAQNDYLRVAAIATRKTNFTFMDYVGVDHNFFPLLPDDKPNYDVFNWDKVAADWRDWLKGKSSGN
ncbi:alpha/beta hydrolase family protein [Chitinophaga tropicalis]|uniref:Alpha/beta hydrolase n=1 Tax=Chitinophaga tropicalis TaxID=2683588 RepID=A0A7K1U556_9BACT|nr:acyl-CoA thioester hydrolase/BAAT C-terminal domain-containing protein [Chitinophaga tropicalis]MVT09491.1 alpha/beta hydrolase [Chitinophaga tropicalis]